jgi:hypothetical protein
MSGFLRPHFDPEALRQFVTRQLLQIGGEIHGKEIVLFCPFHRDEETGKPNLRVHIGNKIAIGGFSCWSCQAHGGWNKLVDKLAERGYELEKVSKETRLPQDPNPFSTLEKEFEDALQSPEMVTPPKGLMEWKGPWRGLDEHFLQEFGAKMWWDKKSEVYRIWFPLFKFGKFAGYTGLRTDFSTKPKSRHLEGMDAKTILFGFEKCHCNTIILVEGQFGALRLWSQGLPTAAILGINNWSEVKRSQIAARGIRRIILLMDADNAGWRANREIAKDLKAGFDVDVIDLPPLEAIDKTTLFEEDDKLDPGNMPESLLNFVKYLYKEPNFIAPMQDNGNLRYFQPL